MGKIRMQSYVIFPFPNALSVRFNSYYWNVFFPETKVQNGKHKNRCKDTRRLIVSQTVRYFQEQLLQESWENVFSTEVVNSSFNEFYLLFWSYLKLVFLIYISVMMEIEVGIPRASRNVDNEKRSYIISKTVITNDKIVVKKATVLF